MALQDLINAASVGATLDLTGMVFNGSGSGEFTNINKAITLLNGHYTGVLTTDPWSSGAINISASNVTIDGMDIAGGSGPFVMAWNGTPATIWTGLTIRNTIITRNRHPGGPFRWHGPHTNLLFEGNTWVNTTNNASAGMVGGRGDEGNPCGAFADGIIFRDNYFEQGNPGYLGLEIKCGRNILVQRNTFRGGGEMCSSWPDCEEVEFDSNDALLQTIGGNPFCLAEQAGPRAMHYHYHHNIVRFNGGLGGTMVYINSIAYAQTTFPVINAECNIFVNGGSSIVFSQHNPSNTGLQESILQNNTLTPSMTPINGPQSNNTLFNNDLDGADACVGGGVTLQAVLATAQANSPNAVFPADRKSYGIHKYLRSAF